MIFNNEEDIVNYLMTAEFEQEELTSDAIKSLLNKFRYYYRKSHCEKEQKVYEIERLEKKVKIYENRLEILKGEIEISDIKYNRLKSKKLSFKERLKGKIF